MGQILKIRKLMRWLIHMKSHLKPKLCLKMPHAALKSLLSLKDARKEPSVMIKISNVLSSSLRMSICKMVRSLLKTLKIYQSALSVMVKWLTRKAFHVKNAMEPEKLTTSFSKISKRFWATRSANAAPHSTRSFWLNIWKRKRRTRPQLFIQNWFVMVATLIQSSVSDTSAQLDQITTCVRNASKEFSHHTQCLRSDILAKLQPTSWLNTQTFLRWSLDLKEAQ